MAYFPNGTACVIYMERYCERCIHLRENQGCPVWSIHFSYGREECNSTSNAKKILDWLIPMSDDGIEALECRMFVEEKRDEAP